MRGKSVKRIRKQVKEYCAQNPEFDLMTGHRLRPPKREIYVKIKRLCKYG